MNFKVKIVEATNPGELEHRINEAINEPDVRGFEVKDVKTTTTFMPGAKVSRGGIFYLASILFHKV